MVNIIFITIVYSNLLVILMCKSIVLYSHCPLLPFYTLSCYHYPISRGFTQSILFTVSDFLKVLVLISHFPKRTKYYSDPLRRTRYQKNLKFCEY